MTAEQANNLEKHYIKKFNSKNEGYNRTSGGGARKSSKTNDVNRLEELTNNLIQLCPALEAPVPNKLLTLQELCEIARKEPSKKLVYESNYYGCHLSTAEEANNYMEIILPCKADHYLWDFLVVWRVWESNPSIITVINTPWLKEKQIEYISFFIKDEKVKKYYSKRKEFPCITEKGFESYDEKYK